jgi:hypothetical protein
VAGPPARNAFTNKGLATVTKGAMGSAFGSMIAGLPVLWGQYAIGGTVSSALAILWLVSVISAGFTFGRAATAKLWLAAPMALFWPLVTIYMLWFR